VEFFGEFLHRVFVGKALQLRHLAQIARGARLTNWDAIDLAGMVGRGTLVKFEDEDSPVIPLAGRQKSGPQTPD
jgi:hypothetical protein